MRKQRIALTREALYREVWSEPIVHVASRLGLSGRGLGKLCARHEIPVPPRGWWAKKQHGHRVRQIPLPDISAKEQIVFEPRETVEKPEDPPEIAREKTAEWRIEVPEDLAIAHPLVKRATAAIRKASREVTKNRVVRWQDRYQAKLVKPGAGHVGHRRFEGVAATGVADHAGPARGVRPTRIRHPGDGEERDVRDGLG